MESEHGDMRVAVVDQANDFHRRLARTVGARKSDVKQFSLLKDVYA